VIETKHRGQSWEIKKAYLEVTLRRGRAIAAYALNRVLRELRLPAVTPADLAPLRAA